MDPSLRFIDHKHKTFCPWLKVASFDVVSLFPELAEMNTKWRREHTQHLINLYRQSPCLYDPANRHYNNKTERNACIANIQAEMALYIPNITIKNVKTKLRTLYMQLHRERRRLNSLNRSACGSDETVQVPALWCYDDLSFLNDNINPISIHKLQRQADDRESCLIQVPSKAIRIEAYAPEEPAPLKKQATPTKNVQRDALSILEKASSILEDEKNCTNGQEEVFCRYLCSEFRRIKNEKIFDKLKLRIMELTYAALEEDGTEEETAATTRNQ